MAVLGPAAPNALGDGDPASDVLLEQNVYFPYRSPSAAARLELQRATDAVYAGGDRVRVAGVFGVALAAVVSMAAVAKIGRSRHAAVASTR